MSTAIAVICAIVAVASSIGWFFYRSCCVFLMWYMKQKGVKPPSNREMVAGLAVGISNSVNALKFWKRKKGDNK